MKATELISALQAFIYDQHSENAEVRIVTTDGSVVEIDSDAPLDLHFGYVMINTVEPA